MTALRSKAKEQYRRSRKPFDSVPYAPGPRKSIGTDGIKIGSIRTRNEGMMLPCGHRNVEFAEDEHGRYYLCTYGHKNYLKDMSA